MVRLLGMLMGIDRLTMTVSALALHSIQPDPMHQTPEQGRPCRLTTVSYHLLGRVTRELAMTLHIYPLAGCLGLA